MGKTSPRKGVEASTASGSVYAPFDWAKGVPTLLLGNKTPDTTAHLVLLTMATFADPDGTNIRPSLPTLTAASHLAKTRTCADAIKRLEAAKLIVRSGEMNGGIVVWALNYAVEMAPRTAAVEAGRDQALSKQAERNRRYRERQRDAAQGRHVTPEVASQPQVSTGTPALDQPLTSQGTFGGTLPPDPLRSDPAPRGRNDCSTAAEQLQDPPAQVERKSPVPRVRERRGREVVVPEVWSRQRSRCSHRLDGSLAPDGTPRCVICRREQQAAS